jgi:hypothetical protein
MLKSCTSITERNTGPDGREMETGGYGSRSPRSENEARVPHPSRSLRWVGDHEPISSALYLFKPWLTTLVGASSVMEIATVCLISPMPWATQNPNFGKPMVRAAFFSLLYKHLAMFVSVPDLCWHFHTSNIRKAVKCNWALYRDSARRIE